MEDSSLILLLQGCLYYKKKLPFVDGTRNVHVFYKKVGDRESILVTDKEKLTAGERT